MKAARFSRFGGPEVLEIVDLPDPHPGPGEVRIAVRGAGVNASDWKKRQGLMDPELPQTLGYEAAGIVDELGAGVTDVAVGDRVFGASPYGAAQAELAALSSYSPIPASLDFDAAAALPAAVETASPWFNIDEEGGDLEREKRYPCPWRGGQKPLANVDNISTLMPSWRIQL